MATVKIHEGTKAETTVELQDDEGIIFVSPEKTKMMRSIPQGCFKGNKQWIANLVITSKRVITIPHQPNKKNYPVESFNLTDITSASMVKPQNAQDAATMAKFTLTMKTPWEGGEFWIPMAMNAGNIFKALAAMNADDNARNAAVYGASLRTAQGQDYVYTQASLDKYYANMAKQAQDRAASMASAKKTSHGDLRDCFVDIINQCVAEANKG